MAEQCDSETQHDSVSSETERLPPVPESASPELVWVSEGPHRPTKAWVHECGSRAARWKQGKTNPKTVYYCPRCDVKRPIATSYGFEERSIVVEVSDR